MNTRHKAPDSDHYLNSREFKRGAVRIAAEIRESGGKKRQIDVMDLSRAGFRMHCLFLFPVKHKVFLTIPGFAALEAAIVWHEGDFYGCQFQHQLYDAVYDHIIQKFPSLGDTP